MYTLKCYKHDGIKHVYAASMYTIYPPEANEHDEIITKVESHALDGKSVPIHYVSLDPLTFAYKEIYVENMSGKTIDVIRGSTKAYADPNAGQASEIEYPRPGLSAKEVNDALTIDPDAVGVGPGQSPREKTLQEKADEAGVSADCLLPVEDVSDTTGLKGLGAREGAQQADDEEESN